MGAVAGLEFAAEGAQVSFGCFCADEKPLADLHIGVAFGHKAEHLPFASG